MSYLPRFKYPVAYALIIHIIPPPKTNEQSAADIFHSPKIHWKKNGYENKTCDEAVAEPSTKDIH